MPDAPSSTSFRLSPSQVRKFFGDLLFGGAQGLNLEQVVCQTTEPLDLPAFRQSWQTILDRHSALRAGFDRDDQQRPYQKIHAPLELPFFVEDHRQIKPDEREGFVEKWLEQDRQNLFELSTPPLMRVTVLQFADDCVTWIWTFHHILLDGRAIVLVLEDFFACYEASCAGRSVTLPERRDFAEFIAWHQDWMSSHEVDATAYWRQAFSSDETDSVLSISRMSSSAERAQKIIKLDIEANLAEGLERLARDCGVTIHTIVLATWALLLSRYYRSKAVTFTSILACRKGSIEGTEGMIGLLMNSLPMHVRLQDEMSVADFLRQIRKRQLATRDYQWTPAEILRNSMPIAAGKQFVDSCVLYERYHIAQEMTDRFGQNGVRRFSLREKSTVPLILSVSERPQLQFELIYHSHTFEADAIAQFGRSFLALLQHMQAAPNASVGMLEPLDSADRARVMAKLDGPGLNFPEDKGLHQWFEDQARKTPDAIAVVAEETLTYEQLDRQATALAERLVTMGVVPDQVVAIFLPRSAEVLVAILGILKSGAAYLPLTVTIPKARIKGLLEEASACIVVTDEEHSRSLPALSVPCVFLDGCKQSAPAGAGRALPDTRGSHLAYVMPTSGTTGRPKLICVEHRQTANLLAYATQSLLQPEDVRYVPFIDAPGFDSSISQIFTTLALGGTLVLIPEILEISKSPYHDKFTCLGSTPSLLSTMLKVIGLPPSVRLIGLGAEAIPADLLDKLDSLPQVRKVINYYGPSEATVYCTIAILLDRSNPKGRIDSLNRGRVIGCPIANTRIYLIDEFGRLAPPGAPGEIYIAGAPVARGYLNPAGKDSQNFLVDHFQADSPERMYRSGDIACLRTDGLLEFHGRKDHQLKFHGVRIEAAEIENALLNFPGIRQAIVDLRTEADGKKRLVAYLEAGGENFPRQRLRKVLRLLLPGAMIPQHFVVLNDFPLLSNGKVDREALSRIELGLETSSASQAPVTPMEIRMRTIWEQNLARNSIGLDHDYFELGGDSLSAINLLLTIEKEFGIRLKPQVLPENSTISELVRVVETTRDATQSPAPVTQVALVPLQDLGEQTPLILIPGGSGEGFLSYKPFAQAFFPDHPVYALQSPYTPMIEEPARPVSDFSTHFARQIVSFVKGRPFVLFGHCVGGLLAWHVACALKNEKSPPFKLVLYDAPVPRKGINIRPEFQNAVPQSRLQRVARAYRLAWSDWSLRNEDTWRSKAGFFLWAMNNALMRKGLDRSESGRDNFAKLAYLRTLQSAPLSTHAGEALLLYHHIQERAVSKSLWQSHCTGGITFEFVPGDHSGWESAIHHTIPLIRQQLDAAQVLK